MPSALTEKQEKWFATLRAGLEEKTGRPLADWVTIAKTCPETKPRARQKWLKDNYCIGQNYAIIIFQEAFGGGPGWGEPEKLLATLWTDPAQRETYEAVAEQVAAMDGAIIAPRKSFVGFSRKYQFAAARPSRDGVRLGLAVPLEADARLIARKSSDSWSERLPGALVLTGKNEVNAELAGLLQRAMEGS